jgi:peptide/nickel transport system permease protein
LGLSYSAAAISIAVGVVIGLLSTELPQLLGRLTMWIVNAFLAIPGLLFAMILVGGLGPGIITVILAVGIGGGPGFARISRTIFHQVQSQKHLEASAALGASRGWIVWFHILPNALSQLVSLATIHTAWAFLGMTTLTFLGFAGDPSIAEWGSMLNAGRLHLFERPLLALLPGVLISLTIIATHNLGAWLSRLADPRRRLGVR